MRVMEETPPMINNSSRRRDFTNLLHGLKFPDDAARHLGALPSGHVLATDGPSSMHMQEVCMCVYVYVCVCVRECACVHVSVNVYIYICVFVRKCICVCKYVYIYMFVYIPAHVRFLHFWCLLTIITQTPLEHPCLLMCLCP